MKRVLEPVSFVIEVALNPDITPFLLTRDTILSIGIPLFVSFVPAKSLIYTICIYKNIGGGDITAR